jgi:uncharacterized membrane protein
MHQPDQPRRGRGIPRRDPRSAVIVAGLGALAGAAAFVWYEQSTRNPRPRRRPDSAPGRTARQARFGRYAVTGRTVTINKPRAELYAFWRDFGNLPRFMEHVKAVETEGDITRWTIAGPLGRDVRLETRIVDDREGEQIAWRSTEASDIDTEGKVMFRDAPAGRGTEVEAIISYVPPAGEIGRWVAKVLQAEPALQARRELKRFKMLMEAGEIATSATRKAEQE